MRSALKEASLLSLKPTRTRKKTTMPKARIGLTYANRSGDSTPSPKKLLATAIPKTTSGCRSLAAAAAQEPDETTLSAGSAFLQ